MEKIVYLGLTGDIIHLGIVNIISKGAKLSNLIIGLLTDNAIVSYKRLPYLTYEQKVQRAYGLLSQSHIMDIVEALTLLSDIRLGIDLGFVNNLTPSQVNQIMITISPAHLQQSAGGNLSLAELDKLRAHTLRGNMKFAGITPA